MFSRGRTNSAKGQMADATWRAGFARLAPLNLTFEAWLYHPQLMELADLARAFPQTTIILNHVGGPLGIGPYADKKEETFAAWKAGIAELGKCQNVVVKLGGLGMLLGMFDFHTRETPPSSEELARAYKPYIETCIVAFGPDRAMFDNGARLRLPPSPNNRGSPAELTEGAPQSRDVCVARLRNREQWQDPSGALGTLAFRVGP